MSRSTAVPKIDVDGSEVPMEIDDRLPMTEVIVVEDHGNPVRVVVAHEVIAEAMKKRQTRGLNIERFTHAGWAVKCMELQREAAASERDKYQ